jgi:hypothetical protein
MNTTQNVYLHTTAFSGSPSQVLREGSSVFVRIISRTGPQSYVASFAGARFPVTSRESLKPGMSFTAVLSFRDGKIALIPGQGTGVLFADRALVEQLQPGVNDAGLLTDQKLAAYFVSLGLAPDAVTLTLFSAMKELGMKFNSVVLSKAHRTAENFPGREREAAEAALILEQKGMPSDIEAVTAVLDGSNGSHQDAEEDDKDRSEEKGTAASVSEKKDVRSTEEISKEVTRFFKGVFDGTIPGSAVPGGFLTVFNHRGFSGKGSDGGIWVQIPFDISLDGGLQYGDGMLRCFLQKNHQIYKKIVVKVDFGMKSYSFVLYFVKDTCRKVRFYVAPNTPEIERERQVNQLRSILQDVLHCNGKIQVEWSAGNVLTGFCTDILPVSVVRGNV